MNKTGLWIILLASMVLFLYPTVTTLLDVLDVISQAPAIPQSALVMRDRAIMQVLGFISLYMFLGAMLYSYGQQPTNQNVGNTHVNKHATDIGPEFSLVAGGLTFFGVLCWQIISGAIDFSNSPTGLVLPISISIIVAAIVGGAAYFIIYFLSNKNRENPAY